MERKECSFCGERIAASAQKCRFCGEWIADVENDDATDIEDYADEEEEQPDEEEYAEPVDPQERAQIDNEIAKFRKTLFSRIADLIKKHGGEAYWYQILEKYEVGIFILVAFIIGLLFLPASILLWLLCFLFQDTVYEFGQFVIAAMFMPLLAAGFAAMFRFRKGGIDIIHLDSGEVSKLFDGIMMRILQFLFLTFPIYLVIASLYTGNWWAILFIPLFIPYILYYKWTGREIDAYKTWICNIACDNYDFLHSNRFRYWNSRAKQDADLTNLRHLSGYRFIPLRCILIAPATAVFVVIIAFLLLYPNI